MEKIKLNPAVYVNAAELIETGRESYSCMAISTVLRRQATNDFGVHRAFYLLNFGPLRSKVKIITHPGGFRSVTSANGTVAIWDDYYGHPYWDKVGRDAEQKQFLKEQRVMALLMMAQISEGVEL